jgi:hypothetical protein
MRTLNFYDIDGQPQQSLPFYLPEKRRGKVSIKHKIVPKGTEETVTSWRNAFFMGLPQARHVLQRDGR